MDRAAAESVISMFEQRDQIESVSSAGVGSAQACLALAQKRLDALEVLTRAEHWDTAFITAYDAYRTVADALVLLLGYRVPGTKGAHRVSPDVAHAALRSNSSVFGPAISDRFRTGRHESEYFDPDRPSEKTREDVEWAVSIAAEAVDVVASAVGAW